MRALDSGTSTLTDNSETVIRLSIGASTATIYIFPHIRICRSSFRRTLPVRSAFCHLIGESEVSRRPVCGFERIGPPAWQTVEAPGRLPRPGGTRPREALPLPETT